MNGCRKKCPGCISPEMQFYDPTKEIYVGDVMRMISRIGDRIDGFTISGGEPFYNPKALHALVSALSTIHDDILIFTGYTLEELQAQGDEEIHSVLSRCAAIVDGQFVQELHEPTGLRGSSNQRCMVFKYHSRYSEMDQMQRSLQSVIFDKGVLTIGIP